MLEAAPAQLRGLYVAMTAGASAPFERAWNVGRLAVLIIVVPAVFASLGNIEDSLPALAAVVFVATYSVGIHFMLNRGCVRAVFFAGLLLDIFVIAAAWSFTLARLGPEAGETDLWLVLMPLMIMGVARMSPAVGLGYVAVVVALLAGITLAFDDPNSYGSSQLPVRGVFLALVGVLSVWLVKRFSTERNTAQSLQTEAETLAEIGAILNSSFDARSVFARIAPLIRSLVPYNTLLLGELAEESDVMKVIGIDSDAPTEDEQSEIVTLQIGSALDECIDQRFARILTGDQCQRLTELRSADGSLKLAEFNALIVAPIVSGDRMIGIIIAGSMQHGTYLDRHQRAFARISEQVGLAMTNVQVYRQALQLTEEKQARHSLDSANRRLQQESEAQAVFLSAVSHELRTPLTSIIAFNDLLQRNSSENLDERQLRHLDVIKRNGKQLAVLVDDLLDLSHLRSRRLRLAPESFKAAEAVDQMTSSVMPFIEMRQQKLVCLGGPPETVIVADSQRLAQILANLLSNASKYSPESSEITLRWSVSDGMFELSVEDHGSGISPEHREHLFQPFFRAPEHREANTPGTGLGLVITKSLLEAHGGGIKLERGQGSPASPGTIVRVWFPADGTGISETPANAAGESA